MTKSTGKLSRPRRPITDDQREVIVRTYQPGKVSIMAAANAAGVAYSSAWVVLDQAGKLVKRGARRATNG